jgi:hypothetical protein
MIIEYGIDARSGCVEAFRVFPLLDSSARSSGQALAATANELASPAFRFSPFARSEDTFAQDPI